MCRHLAYLGPPLPIGRVVFDAPHSLCLQAARPRLQADGDSNPDGFGWGWYPDERTRYGQPSRFRDARPIWADAAFAARAAQTRSRCFLASVRSATPGYPVEERCTQPFTAGPYLFSHNGAVENFERVRAKLADQLDSLGAPPDVQAPVDSAFVFGLALARWRRGMGLAEGLADVVDTLIGITGGRFNLLATDGRSLAGTTCGESLFLGDGLGVALASEPFDGSPGWQPVPPYSVVSVEPDRVVTSRL